MSGGKFFSEVMEAVIIGWHCNAFPSGFGEQALTYRKLTVDHQATRLSLEAFGFGLLIELSQDHFQWSGGLYIGFRKAVIHSTLFG